MGIYKGDQGYELAVTGRDIDEDIFPMRFDKGITWAWQPLEVVPGVKAGSRQHRVLRAIEVLSSDGEATVTRIAKVTGIDKGDVSKIVAALKSKGLVFSTKGARPNEQFLFIQK